MIKRILRLGFYFTVTLIVLLLTGLTACRHASIRFKSPAVSATVVDAKTGRPLAGVKVNVRWSAMRSTENMHNPDSMDLHSIDLATDANGVFTVPAWGPVTLGWGWFYFSTDPEVFFPEGSKDNNLVYNKNHEGFNEIQPWPFQTVTFELPSWNGQPIPR